MATSVASISSIGDDEGYHDGTLPASHTGPSLAEPASHSQARGTDGSQYEATGTSQRLLGEENYKSRNQPTVQEMEKGSLKSRSSKPGRRSWYYDWWFWEIVGMILNLGATVAIVAIFARYNDKPLPKWKYGITLNAMLSVLSTISKVRLA